MRLLRPPPRSVGATYDLAASHYEQVATVWETVVGGPATAHFRSLLRHHVPSGALVLDVGAGTGRSMRALFEESHPRRAVGLDLSAGMLAQARQTLRDPRAVLVRGDATALPFPDNSFDIVMSMWTLETLPDPLLAVAELLRVLKPSGTVLTVFSTLPDEPIPRLAARLIEAVMRPGFAGRFVPESERPLHDCTMSCAHYYDHGLATITTFGKACLASAVAQPRR